MDADIRLRFSFAFAPAVHRLMNALCGVLMLPFSFSSSPARDPQHRTWRLRCCLLEVGLRRGLDLAASHRLDHLYLSWHLWSHDSFLPNLDQLLKLFNITSTRSFQGVRTSSGTFSLVELEIEIRLLVSLKSHAPCATGRQCLFPKAETQSCWRNENRASKLAVSRSCCSL